MNFDEIIKLSQAQTAKSQTEQRAKELIRLNQKKEQAKRESLAEQAEKLEITRRRNESKQRELDKLKEEKRKKLVLPKFNNAYSAKKWREENGLKLDGSEDPKPLTVKSVIPPKQSTSKLSLPKIKSSSSTQKREVKETTLEERAAKRKRDLFADDDDDDEIGGTMALARLNKSKSSNSLSSTYASSSTNTSTTRISSKKVIKKSTMGAGGGNSTKDRLKSNFNPNEFKKLNLVKKDMRTIEEVERDMKIRSGKDQIKKKSSTNSSTPSKKKTIAESSSEEEESEEEPRKYRSKHSSQIQEMFNRGRSNREIVTEYNSEDDSDDMEVNGDDLRREEERATKVSLREEKFEIERAQKIAEEKRKRLSGR